MVAATSAGGTARHVAELAVGCRNRGFEVHVICASRPGTATDNPLLALGRAGVAVEQLEIRRELHLLHDGAAAVRLRRLVLSGGPDVLHLHSSKAGALGRTAVVGLGRRRPAVVYTPHAYAFLAQPGRLARMGYWCVERALLSSTDCVLAVSQSEAQAASRLGARGRIRVIPNGIDAGRHISPSSERSERHGAFRIGWLGRMTWQKNPDAAIKVSFVLSRLGVDHELLLGGDGPDRDRVLNVIQRSQTDASVRMLGFVHDTDSFHAGIDALLITSRSEGLPYGGLDAMACGVPIVGFDVPGVRDLVHHGTTGLLAAPADVGALAAHLARLARDASLRRTLGAAAQRRVRQEFRLEDQVDRLCQVYHSIASKRASDIQRW